MPMTNTSLQENSAHFEEKFQKALDKALYAGGNPAAQKLRNFLNGTWLGEPLHVALTDIPIGAWTVSTVLDAVNLINGNRDLARAADAALVIGIVGAGGAAVTGLTDWSDVDPPARRVGLIHGLLNVGVLALFTTSLILRNKRSRATAKVFSAIGFGLMTYTAHLGGRMVYEHRVGVDRTAELNLPDAFAAVLEESKLAENKPTRAMYNDSPILLVRRGERIFAMAEKCAHFGGPLSEGELKGDSIVCPWHSSTFSLKDGSVINGPAVHPQPCLEVRTRNGQIEVRRPKREEEQSLLPEKAA
jgi:nitrite reductase/ring-hydroxylating ferredoxin subunit/uncharacterized membrane protein